MKFFNVVIIFKSVYGLMYNPILLKKSSINIVMNLLYEQTNHKPIIIHGDSLQTWSYSENINRLQLFLNSEGRPYDAEVKLWQGPNNTPFKLRVYSENGYERPFLTLIEVPNSQNTVCIKNIQDIAFPIEANIITTNLNKPNFECINSSKKIQGNSLKTFKFNPIINRIQVLLKTDGRPLNSRIELLQGPNSNKQIIEVYSENGLLRPFFAIFETPGQGNVINIINTSPIEFPIFASVVQN